MLKGHGRYLVTGSETVLSAPSPTRRTLPVNSNFSSTGASQGTAFGKKLFGWST